MSNDDIRRRLCGSRHHWETILYSVSTARAWSVARANFVVILFSCQPNSIWSKYYLANTQILFGHLTKRSMSNLCVLPFQNNRKTLWHAEYIYMASFWHPRKQMPLSWDRGWHKQRFSVEHNDGWYFDNETKHSLWFHSTLALFTFHLGGDK